MASKDGDLKLGAAFGAAAGIVPPPPRRAVVPVPSRRTGRAPTPVGERVDADTAVVYLSQRVHGRLKRYVEQQRRKPARRDGRGRVLPRPSYTSVTLEAVTDLRERLGELLGPDDAADGALFTVRRPQGRILDGASVQVSLTPGSSNTAVLDGLAQGLGVSRSALVDAVLDEWLPQTRRNRDATGILGGSAGG